MPKVLSLEDFTAGLVAGSISRTVTAPADRLKTELQVRTGSRPGVLAVGRQVMCAQGARGFFQGNLTNCIKVAPQSALFFAFSDSLRRVLPADLGLPGAQEEARSFLAGTLAGVASQFIIYPLEPIKTHLTIAPRGLYAGPLDCGKQLVRSGGVRALYSGAAATLVGCVPYSGTQLLAYDALRSFCMRRGGQEKLPTSTSLMCGLASSTVAMTISYPLTLVRTRLQVQGSGSNGAYRGVADCLRKTVAREGFAGLMRGIGPNLLKAAPAAAVNFAVYEMLKESLGQRRKA